MQSLRLAVFPIAYAVATIAAAVLLALRPIEVSDSSSVTGNVGVVVWIGVLVALFARPEAGRRAGRRLSLLSLAIAMAVFLVVVVEDGMRTGSAVLLFAAWSGVGYWLYGDA